MFLDPFQPTPDEFAELIAESFLAGNAGNSPARLGREEFLSFVRESYGRPERRIALESLYRDYCSGDQWTKEQILLKVLGESVGTNAHAESLQAKMLPFLRERWTIEKMRLEALASGSLMELNERAFPQRVVAEHFSLVVALSTEEGMVCVTNEHLREAGVDFEQALMRAVANIHPMEAVSFQTLTHADTHEVVLHSAPTRSGFDAARAILTGQVESLPVCGERLMFIVNRNNMMVIGAAIERGLMYAYSELRGAQKHAHVMPPFPILVQDGKYSSYRVPATSLWQNFFRDMELRYLANLYRKQKSLLAEPRFSALNGGFPLLDFELARNDSGRMFSYCDVVERSLPALLPRTDFIYFHNSNGRVAAAPADRVIQAIPEMQDSTDLYPQRVLISKFPNGSQLSRIGLFEPSD